MENREAKTSALSFLSLTYILSSSSEKVFLSAVTVCTPGAAFAYSSSTHITKCALEHAPSIALVMRSRAGGAGEQGQYCRCG